MKTISECCLIAILLYLQCSAQTRHDTFIHLTTGDSLDATYFVPNTSPPTSGYPALMFIPGFGLDKSTETASCSLYTYTGYFALCYSVRGQGNSSGQSTIMAFREREDFREVISFLRSLPNIDTSNIGISGGSQGGLHGLWAAADRLPVKAVTTDVISPHWATDMLVNGSIRRTLLLLLTTNTVRYAPERDSLWQLVRTDQFDSLKAHFTPTRDIDTSQLSTAAVPIMTFIKWQDHYFTAADGIEAYLRYSGQKKIYVGTRGHSSDQVESQRVYQDDQLTRWMAYFLKGQQNGILSEMPITYAYSSLPMDTSGYFMWTRVGVTGWPPLATNPLRLYLNVDSSISYAPNSAVADTMILRNDYTNPAYTFDTAYVEGFRGPRFDVYLAKHSLAFTSPRITSDVTWIGVPKMHLYVHSDFVQFPLHAQVYEVDSLGVKYFVNRINFTSRHWQPGAGGEIFVDGAAHAHKFTAGSRIRVELANIDVTNRIVLGSYPFVLPMFATTRVSILMDALHPSYIELPAIGSPNGVEIVDNRKPTSTRLLQNYPNPFNPSTNITLEIGARDMVNLSIIDVLGRNVVTLVDQELQSGVYNVHWNASGNASGVYFYRLKTRNFTDIRKMLLIR